MSPPVQCTIDVSAGAEGFSGVQGKALQPSTGCSPSPIPSSQPFTDRDEALLVRLTIHAAIAIQNAHLS